MAIFLKLIARDFLLACRRAADVWAILFFFIMVASLFPLAVGADLKLLQRLAPGVLWVAALLSTLLSLPRLFADDFADGTLAQMALSPLPLPFVVLAKTTAHWLLSGVPLAIIAPILGIQFDLPFDALLVLMLTLLIGTPALSAIGTIGAALTLGLRSGGVLVSLIILPLYIPVLIFGSLAVDAALDQMEFSAHLSLIAAMALASFSLAPFASAAALKLALE